MSKNDIIDIHMHVGLKGDSLGDLGHFSDWYQRQLVFKTFLLYARIDEEKVCDSFLTEKTLEVIEHSGVDKVVCLALDHVYDLKGNPLPKSSHMWVANEYITDYLMKKLPDKILLGASIHPYDEQFEKRIKRIKESMDKKVVLMKWLPSAQQIDLAEDITLKRMKMLADLNMPLLLHIGTELAIPSTDERTNSYNFLSWKWKDKLANFFRFKKRWYTPKIDKIHENLKAALDAGTKIIFAHCGLPYFVSGFFGEFFEHSDFKSVKQYLMEKKYHGKCYSDVSATCTPFRKKYFKKINKLPLEKLLFGSDFPTPVFELSADFPEMMDDLKAILNGDFWRIIIPQDNLIDVNLRELKYFFPGHPMFTNFNNLIPNSKER